MKQRVVITGIGAVTAAGHGRQDLWKALMESRSLLTPIERFNTGLLRTRMAGQVPGFNPGDWMTKVLSRQTDRSTQFAMAASIMGLKDAGIDMNETDKDRIGMMVGHALGGMEFSEPNLYNSWFLGPEDVSPYQAIAWFYAAAQGQTSIALGIKGNSKSFVSDRLSGLHAVGHAYRTLADGKLDICVAGGTEAPLSPFICLAIESAGKLGRDSYAPFTAGAEGILLGEGACFLILENLDSALKRNADILAEIKGFAMATDCTAGNYDYAGADTLLRSMSLCVKDSGIPRIDHVFADGAATAEGDRTEREALGGFNGHLSSSCLVSVPKTVVGDMYGAGGPLQAAAAALSIYHQTALPLETGENKAAGLAYIRNSRPGSVQSALINGRGFGGLCASLLLSQYK